MKRACVLLLLTGCPTLPGIDDGGADAGRPQVGPIVNLAVGSTHACATSDDGGVWCWGCYCSGAVLGTLTADGRPVPIRGVSSPIQLALGQDLSCALLSGGKVQCWGRGSEGQLGNGATDDRSAPVEVSTATRFDEVSAGARHVCARSGANVECWGDNRERQLGDGTTDDQKNAPVSLGNLNATQIDLGAMHSCALRASGSTVCWGDNAFGQVGDTSIMDRNTPTPVTGNLGGLSISAGGTRSCLLRDTDRGVSCWGDHVTVPTDVLSSDGGFTELAVGDSDLCVRVADDVRCLDAGTFTIPGAVQLAAGKGFSCVRTDGGEVWCWGKNDVGQLGTGQQSAASAVPVRVEF